jgi:opacity protein-like surface antigen
MKTIKQITFLLSSIFMLVGTSHAAPYVGVELGTYGYGNNNAFKNIFDNKDNLGLSGRVSGGYLWNTKDCINLGVEAGVNAYDDKQDKKQINRSRMGIDALAVADMYVAPRVDVFAKAGTSYSEQETTNKVSHIRVVRHNFVPKAAVGAGYDLTDNMNLNVSYQHEFQRSQLNAITSVMAGLKYRF